MKCTILGQEHECTQQPAPQQDLFVFTLKINMKRLANAAFWLFQRIVGIWGVKQLFVFNILVRVRSLTVIIYTAHTVGRQ